jgi:hypothetical protein
MKKLGRCSRCKEKLTKPGHKYTGAVICDNCYFGSMKHYPDGSYPDGTRPGTDPYFEGFLKTIGDNPGLTKIAKEMHDKGEM